ncbi:MAG: putative hydrolase [Edaphobacter sp.]|nr:putative hydrolase [Edaphobacter sp.]
MLWLGLRTHLGTRRMRARAFLGIMPPEYLVAQDRDALAERLKPLFGHALADSPPIVMCQLNALNRFDVTARLPELAEIPTLVFSATRNRIFPPKYGRRLATAIPEARYVEIPDAAHGVTIQSAEVVKQDCSSVLSR